MHRLVRSLLAWPGTPWTAGSLALILGALAIVFLTGGPTLEATTVPQENATDITYGPKGARVVARRVRRLPVRGLRSILSDAGVSADRLQR